MSPYDGFIRSLQSGEEGCARVPEGAKQFYWPPLDTLLNRSEARRDQDLQRRTSAQRPWGPDVVAAVRGVRELRESVERACEALPSVAPWMDAPAAAMVDRWTIRVAGELRQLRGCVLAGQPDDIYPSCLPWVEQGVPHQLETLAAVIRRRMEKLKSVGFQLRHAGPAIDPGPGRQPAVGATPAAAAAAGGAPILTSSEPHMTDVHIAVLKRLRSVMTAQSRGQLWVYLSQHGRDTIRNAVDELHQWGFVHGPRRSTRGISILDKGRAWLETYERGGAV